MRFVPDGLELPSVTLEKPPAEHPEQKRNHAPIVPHAGPAEAAERVPDLGAALHEQAARTRAIVAAHDLADIGQTGERWGEGTDPATLERVLFHLLQEYARHIGQLDIVCELAGGPVGE